MADIETIDDAPPEISERELYEQIRASGPLRGHGDNSDEEGPWSRKCVISFDGGGVRGYSSLLILKKIMDAIRRIETTDQTYTVASSVFYPWMGTEKENAEQPTEPSLDNFLPCHYFDYMAGTSTGGLSSIMLGRLRMTVDEALDEYVNFGNAIFGKPRLFHERSLLWYPRVKFSSRKTRLAFQTVVFNSLKRDQVEAIPDSAVNEPFMYKDDRTRTMVVSWSIKKQKGLISFSGRYLWRSYEANFPAQANFPVQANRSGSWTPCSPDPRYTISASIWQVARATTAAPRYFQPIKIGDRKFLDGAMTANNPSLAALKEFRALHNYVPALFVSIGTGLREAAQENRPQSYDPVQLNQALSLAAAIDDVRKKHWLRNYFEISRNWTRFMTDTEGEAGNNGWRDYCHATHLEMAFRLNVKTQLVKVPLDEWKPADSGEKTLDTIRGLTAAYLARPDVRETIDQIAREAVNIRRRRAMTQRWESFAVDVSYSCPICQQGGNSMDRDQLRGHLQEGRQHINGAPMTPEEIESTLNAGRTYSKSSKRWFK